jgi:hypothetical protein
LKVKAAILFVIISLLARPGISRAQDRENTISFDFCDQLIRFNFNRSLVTTAPTEFSSQTIHTFYDNVNKGGYEQMIRALMEYKEKYRPDDWLFYQLIRKTAQHISPKADNYFRYTLYKWFLLTKTGYDAMLAISGNRILFYVRCDENIYNIPTRTANGKQYVCLNYHDYKAIDFLKERFAVVELPVPEAQHTFSYKITHLPDFKLSDYRERDLRFSYNENDYNFKVKLNPQIQTLFTNYPVVDYELFMNIPLSNETYRSLIPLLKKNLKGMNIKSGVDYLMKFTRYAFLFQPDSENFGAEKRLSPEQTLLYDKSDCEDRVALFFYLVKEIYNLPMIVLNFPKHVTIAVQFDKPVGRPIIYKGQKYSVCEPTPQKEDLVLGQLLPALKGESYEVAYVYTPR